MGRRKIRTLTSTNGDLCFYFDSEHSTHQLRPIAKGSRHNKPHILKGHCLFCSDKIDKDEGKYMKKGKGYQLAKDWREVKTLSFLDHVKTAIIARKLDSWANEVL